MDAQRLLNLSLTAGEIMLSSGAETHRVEDTMKRILQAGKCADAETFVTTTGIFAGGTDDGRPVSMLRRVKTRSFNMEKIALVNDLSRKLCHGQINMEQAETELAGIQTRPLMPMWARLLSSGATSLSFCYIFGGGLADCLCAFGTGLLVYLLYAFMNRRSVSWFIVTVICGALISLCAMTAFSFLGGISVGKIIVGAIMPLVPGLTLTNAIRDILEGDYLSGASRMMDAVITALAIAAGVGFVLKSWMLITGAAMETDFATGAGPLWLQVVMAFTATYTFAIIFNVPVKELAFAGLCGAAGWLLYSPLAVAAGPSIATFTAVVTVTLIAKALAVYRKTPIVVFLAAGIIPFVPGAGIYGAMYHLVVNENTAAALMGIGTCKTAGLIAVGIIFALSLPNVKKARV